ncbi:MAG TPA: MGMT family protein [Acidimicrobiia bacterium]|jgi:methylated-DNA-protein-cysteine methyltransferase-like protein|nr:MGMT family protein [Acidimicrobiia bacterium]
MKSSTAFEEAVLSVLRNLEAGEVVTYGEVAELAGYPGRARGVGRILAITEEDLPWWRVVGSGGKLRSPHPALQAHLLASEQRSHKKPGHRP